MIFIFDFVTCTKLPYPFIADGLSDDTIGSDFGTNAVNGDATESVISRNMVVLEVVLVVEITENSNGVRSAAITCNQLLGNLMKTSKNVLACKYTTLSTHPAVRKGCIRRLKMFNFY